MNGGMSIGLAAVLLFSASAHGSGVNGTNNGMPNRISMNVTVPKQTQGATFGEKVNAGLQSAGGVVASGASRFVVDCGQSACVVVLADGNGFRADIEAMTMVQLSPQQAASVHAAPAGAALVGGLVPGGSILSAAVSSVGSLAGGSGGGAAAASYAKTGAVASDGLPLHATTTSQGDINVLEPLADGDYELAVVVEKATRGLKDTLKTQVRTAARQRVRIVVGFSVEAGVLKTKHDTAKNSVGNIR